MRVYYINRLNQNSREILYTNNLVSYDELIDLLKNKPYNYNVKTELLNYKSNDKNIILEGHVFIVPKTENNKLCVI